MQRMLHNMVLVAMVLWAQLLMAQGSPQIDVQLVDSIQPVVSYDLMNRRVAEAEEKIQAMHFVSEPTPAMKRAVAEDKAFMERMFQPRWPDLVGLSTLSQEGRDILLARWSPGPGSAGLKGVLLWDAPDFDLFLFEVNSKLLSTADATRQLLQNLFVLPNRSVDIVAIRFKIERGAESKGTTGIGWSEHRQIPQSGNMEGYELYLAAYRTATKAYLCVLAGKRLMPDVFDPNTVFVAERFPPLSDRLKQMDMIALLQEFHGGAERESLVADEILSRKLSSQEFNRLFEVPLADQPTRVSTILGEMVRLNKVSQFQTQVKDLIDNYVQQGQGRAEAIAAMLRSLRGSEQIDLSDTALDLIRKNIATKEGIVYLEFRGHTKQTAETLQGLQVPNELEQLKALAAREIFKRSGVWNQLSIKQ